MSTSQAQAAVAAVSTAGDGASVGGQGQGKGGDKKVVPFPAGGPNLNLHPLTRDAQRHYERRNLVRGMWTDPMRCYVEADMIRRLAIALKRQLTEEDLNLFYGAEATDATCAMTGQPFRPVWWVIITQKVIDIAGETGQIPKDKLVKVGQFFLSPDVKSREFQAFSGYVRSWGGRDPDRAADQNQPIMWAWQKNGGKWGYPLDGINQMIADRDKRKQEADEQAGRLVKLAGFFDGVPDPGIGPRIGGQNRPHQPHDRRDGTFVPRSRQKPQG